MHRPIALASVLLLAGLVTLGASAGASHATLRLTVVACATLVGAPGPVRPGPARVEVTVPARYRGRVALYVDRDHRLVPVLAPAHWRCRAEDAADGQAGLEVSAPGGARGGLVVASLDGPCRSCVAADVCRLSAVSGYSGSSAGACPASPAGLRATFLSGSRWSRRALVSFRAARLARVPYGAWPSRMPVEAITRGTMAYDLSASPWARIVTCALPRDLAGLCGTVVARGG
ncbi:MAG TPA: hypothetical protein PLS29_04565 [Acidimicrobiales bacterium]|nr:MAG: hypothetical protein B7Z69_06900 [Actinobacteria bacterium 21-73-9]HQU26288.1 hypothetical protein [Acidimicrobiales bacterium]